MSGIARPTGRNRREQSPVKPNHRPHAVGEHVDVLPERREPVRTPFPYGDWMRGNYPWLRDARVLVEEESSTGAPGDDILLKCACGGLVLEIELFGVSILFRDEEFTAEPAREALAYLTEEGRYARIVAAEGVKTSETPVGEQPYHLTVDFRYNIREQGECNIHCYDVAVREVSSPVRFRSDP